MDVNRILTGNLLPHLQQLPDKIFQTCVTSPPYWALRKYGNDPDELGMEKTPEEYVARMVAIFREVRRVLRDDGTLWLNIGDTYMGGKGANGASVAYLMKHGTDNRINGKALMETTPGEFRPNDRNHPFLKAKQLCGIPWRLAFAMQEDGWILRQDIIWNKPNPMPESTKDRCTKSHEYIFLFAKQKKYFYNYKALQEPAIYGNGTQAGMDSTGFKDPRRFNGKHSVETTLINSRQDYPGVDNGMRNKRDVWTIPTTPYKEAHYATFPEEIPRLCIGAGSKEGDLVLDPFCGAGTTAMVATCMKRNYIAIELYPKNVKMAEKRIKQRLGSLFI